MIWKTKPLHLPEAKVMDSEDSKETLSRLRIIKTSPNKVKGIAPSYIDPSSETPLSIHYYGWLQKWTQIKPIYQSTEFISMNASIVNLTGKPCISLLNSYLRIISIVNPNEKAMYQSNEFITMNDCSSEPKWLAITTLYHVSVLENRFCLWIKGSKICYWEESPCIRLKKNYIALFFSFFFFF